MITSLPLDSCDRIVVLPIANIESMFSAALVSAVAIVAWYSDEATEKVPLSGSKEHDVISLPFNNAAACTATSAL